MSNILFINSCPRQNSRTLRLARKALEKMMGEIKEVRLFDELPAYLTQESLKLRDECVAKRDFSNPMFGYAHDFSQAERIVIAAPYWDLTFPAALKSYLENVSVSGITFRYTDKGIPNGLCKARRLIYITTAGGFIGENDFGFSYVKALSQKLFGIDDVICISAQGLDISEETEKKAMEKAIEEIEGLDL